MDRKHLVSVMKEHGLEDSMLNEVLDIIGYTDRMSLSVEGF